MTQEHKKDSVTQNIATVQSSNTGFIGLSICIALVICYSISLISYRNSLFSNHLGESQTNQDNQFHFSLSESLHSYLIPEINQKDNCYINEAFNYSNNSLEQEYKINNHLLTYTQEATNPYGITLINANASKATLQSTKLKLRRNLDVFEQQKRLAFDFLKPNIIKKQTKTLSNSSEDLVTLIKPIKNANLVATLKELNISKEYLWPLIQAYDNLANLNKAALKGAKIKVVMKAIQDRNHKKKYGKVIFSSLLTKNGTHNIFLYSNDGKRFDYFSDEGYAIRKYPNDNKLILPLKNIKITSPFGIRKHPRYGTMKFHKGIDLSAPTGTPIFASGNGVIEEIGNSATGYGKYLKIQHGNRLSSLYAHVSKIAPNITKGKRIVQGQLIAYVGSTGNALGSHLHYEVVLNQKHINPMHSTVKTSTNPYYAYKLQNKELKKFQDYKTKFLKTYSFVSGFDNNY